MVKTKGFYEKYIKRLQDLILSLIASVLLSPVLIVVYIEVIRHLGSPAIFKQKRIGKNQMPFEMYKFRSMTNERDEETGELLPEELRLTKFGKILRSSSLDELPQLFNIIKGDMSFIGPRPQIEDYLSLYSEEQLRRHEVRPGLSGYAQVNGRNDITWTKRFEYDIEYVDNITFLGDWKIMFLTIIKVLKKEGVNSDENIMMERFDGTN
ncbi:MAG: sugar transferase [Bacillota bacterium]|nr:sugar transferase [Bacillota bacterium]NLL26148.1 sugar transferase [Erysipelotrichia bacterium]